MKTILLIILAIFSVSFGAGTIAENEDKETYATCFCVCVVVMGALAIFK